MKFPMIPPVIIKAFCHHALLAKDSGPEDLENSCFPCPGSSIPAISTYPPRGISARRKLVFPKMRFTMVGPKPMENVGV